MKSSNAHAKYQQCHIEKQSSISNHPYVLYMRIMEQERYLAKQVYTDKENYERLVAKLEEWRDNIQIEEDTTHVRE